MAARTPINVRMEPAALARLHALAAKLSLSRTAVIHLALARLAELEGITSDEVEQGKAAA
jgi:predicted transcriptional regulator